MPNGQAIGAHLAADAHRFEHDLGAGRGVDLDRLDRARVQAPGLVALRAGVGHLAPGLVEIEDLDPRLRRIEDPVVLVRAGHLALQTARALAGIEVKGFLHGSS